MVPCATQQILVVYLFYIQQCVSVNPQLPIYAQFYYGASLMAQLVKNLPAVWETGFNPWVGKIPWRRERLLTPVFQLGEFHGLYSPGVAKSRTQLSDFHFHFVMSKTNVGWYLLPSSKRLSIRLLERQDTCTCVTLKSPGSLNLPMNICKPYWGTPDSFSFLIFTFYLCSS